MKVLGIVFDTDLSWSPQVTSTIQKTNRTLFGLKKIRRFLTAEQAKTVVTSFYFTSLYYGMEVWNHRYLAFGLKQKLKSAHYRALRVIHGKDKTREANAQTRQTQEQDKTITRPDQTKPDKTRLYTKDKENTKTWVNRHLPFPLPRKGSPCFTHHKIITKDLVF